MEIKISLHPESYVCKPKDKRVIAKISNEIADKQATQMLKEVARLVGEEGHTFCPAIFFLQEGKEIVLRRCSYL